MYAVPVASIKPDASCVMVMPVLQRIIGRMEDRPSGRPDGSDALSCPAGVHSPEPLPKTARELKTEPHTRLKKHHKK